MGEINASYFQAGAILVYFQADMHRAIPFECPAQTRTYIYIHVYIYIL